MNATIQADGEGTHGMGRRGPDGSESDGSELMLFRGRPDLPGHLALPVAGPLGNAARLLLGILKDVAPFDRLGSKPGVVVAVDAAAMAAAYAALWASEDPACESLPERAVVSLWAKAERVAEEPGAEWFIKVVRG